MSKKRKVTNQRGTMKMVQYTDGLVAGTVNVHEGRVTRRFFGPASDNPDMALELFRPALKDFNKAL
jgi:hypothetical protein